MHPQGSRYWCFKRSLCIQKAADIGASSDRYSSARQQILMLKAIVMRPQGSRYWCFKRSLCVRKAADERTLASK
jgi:hypothetical protein